MPERCASIFFFGWCFLFTARCCSSKFLCIPKFYVFISTGMSCFLFTPLHNFEQIVRKTLKSFHQTKKTAVILIVGNAFCQKGKELYLTSCDVFWRSFVIKTKDINLFMKKWLKSTNFSKPKKSLIAFYYGYCYLLKKI